MIGGTWDGRWYGLYSDISTRKVRIPVWLAWISQDELTAVIGFLQEMDYVRS